MTDVKLRRHRHGCPLAQTPRNVVLTHDFVIARKSRKDGETLSQGQSPCTCPWLRVSPSFRLLRAITKSRVSTTFRGVYANGQPCLCRRNLTSVTCQNVPGPPPAFPIVWEVGPGNKATLLWVSGFHLRWNIILYTRNESPHSTMYFSLISRRSGEGKEHLVTTVCACV